MPQSNETRKAKRAENVRRGMCYLCGKRPPKQPGRRYCGHCLAHQKKHREKKHAAGICVNCTEPPKPGHRRCERCLAATRSHRDQTRHEAIMAYGGYRCACPGCNVTEPKFLQLDHINNDGAAHRRLVGTGSGMFYWLKKNGYPKGFQVLCANCNYAKAHYGRCPHHDTEVKNDRRKQSPLQARQVRKRSGGRPTKAR